jgi:hypothetical protein
MLSFHALPHRVDGDKEYCTHRVDVVEKEIETIPICTNYTNMMRGINVQDQYKSVYSCQVGTYKWWHMVFMSLLNSITINIFIIHKATCSHFDLEQTLSHLEFQM